MWPRRVRLLWHALVVGTSERVVDDDGVVRIGSVLFALIRPTDGHDRAFNHWYERDHFYTTAAAAPGVFSAARFIEPAQRLHLALYFVLPGFDEAREAFAVDQMVAAREDDRLFTEREHLHTWTYSVESASAGPGGVPPALVLDRRYASVAVGWADADAPRPDADVVLVLRTAAPVMPSAWDEGIDPTQRRMVVAFGDALDGDPFADLAGYHWSARFEPAVVGTDTHVPD